LQISVLRLHFEAKILGLRNFLISIGFIDLPDVNEVGVSAGSIAGNKKKTNYQRPA
jgi:hypothetical protein